MVSNNIYKNVSSSISSGRNLSGSLGDSLSHGLSGIGQPSLVCLLAHQSRLVISRQSRCLARRLLVLMLLLTTSILFTQTAVAQRVQPMVYELDTSGSGATRSLRIENSKSTPITLEFVASKLMLDELGQESNEPAEDDFLIFPPQALIKPGKTQLVRVKYVGDPLLEQSQAYRISVKQLPVTLDKSDSTGVAMLVNFNTLANVVPKSTKAELAITEIAPADNNMWAITVENTGSKYARLSKTQWTVESLDGASKPMVLKKDQVGGLTELNLVLPNSKLTQLIPAFEGFDPSKTRITIDTKAGAKS